jgi:hypothetical protein
MIGVSELVALLRGFGIDPETLLIDEVAHGLARKSVNQITARIGGASMEFVRSLAKRWRQWERHKELIQQLETATDRAKREGILREHLALWLKENKQDADEIAAVLYRSFFLVALRSHCETLPYVGALDLPLDLTDVFVPQTLRLDRSRGPDGKRRPSTDAAFTDLWSAVQAGSGRVLITGNAGSGKSTQLRQLVIERANAILTANTVEAFLDAPLPIYVSAADLAKEQVDLASALAASIARDLGIKLPFPMPTDFFDLRKPGAPSSLLLAIDAVDELEPLSRVAFVKTLSRAYEDIGSELIIIAASRPIDRHQRERWSGFTEIRIFELDQAQTVGLAAKLIRDKGAARAFTGRYLEGKPDLPRNPLLLTLAALSHESGTALSGASLYHEFVWFHLTKRQKAGLLAHDPKAVAAALRVFAGELMRKDAYEAALAFASQAGLIPEHATGAERVARFEEALLSSGIVVRQGERLRFLHESFQSYLRAEQLAKDYGPSNGAIWRAINPFVEGWDVVVFVIELWKQEGFDIAGAVRGLLAFGDDGFRAISTLASHLPILPAEIVQLAVGRWTRLNDGFWVAALIDGPVDQLGLIAFNYEEARAALRKMAADSSTYSEDAAYAARALARVGCIDDGHAALDMILHNANTASTDRVMAAELIGEIRGPADAVRALRSLLAEWSETPPDMELARIRAGEVLYRYGRKREALTLLAKLSRELTSDLELFFVAEAYADLGQTGRLCA